MLCENFVFLPTAKGLKRSRFLIFIRGGTAVLTSIIGFQTTEALTHTAILGEMKECVLLCVSLKGGNQRHNNKLTENFQGFIQN